MRVCFASFRHFADGPVRAPVLENDPVNIAYALQGDYFSYYSLRRLSRRQLAAKLAGYDLVMTTLDTDALPLVQNIADAAAGRLATYSENHLGEYQHLAPAGQLGYVAVLRQAEINFSYWKKHVPMFETLGQRPSAYLPYPFLLEAAQPYKLPLEQRPRRAMVPTGLAGYTRNGLISLTVLRQVLEARLVDEADCWPDAQNFEQDARAAAEVLFPDGLPPGLPSPVIPWRTWLQASRLDYRPLLKVWRRLRPKPAAAPLARVKNVTFYRRTGWPPYLARLGQARLLIDMNNRETVGRNALDCAALGVPCVSTDRSDMQAQLFPQTTLSDPWDVAGAVAVCRQLLTDRAFYAAVVAYAAEQVELFTPEAFRRRFDDILARHPALSFGQQAAAA